VRATIELRRILVAFDLHLERVREERVDDDSDDENQFIDHHFLTLDELRLALGEHLVFR